MKRTYQKLGALLLALVLCLSLSVPALAAEETGLEAAAQQAQQILDNATNDANNIRLGAIQYTDNVLKSLEDIIGHAMETTKARTENLLSSLQGCYDVVNANRVELSPEGEDLQDDPAKQDTGPGAQKLQVTEI